MENTILQADYSVKTLREINAVLFQALSSVLMSHPIKGGKLDYPTKELDNLEGSLNHVEVRYFGAEPDGEAMQREFDEWVKDGKELISDVDAFYELTSRLQIMQDRFIF